MVFVWVLWEERNGFGLVWLGLCMERKGFGWGRGPLANKVWIQPRSLAGCAPRTCGHKDLGRNLRPQVGGA